ncbi:CoA-binding protein [Luteitalea sp. TBR-22]|uniref:CoA-binding protein n=1 Tax=Luteitalea sp. TBR-22 TaxID=2802971 RepID=UPI001AF47B70|nr:CoA-binding protein [Luteitalea sp. TBR-22]BCS35179.1 CoA-binding protein [Luteitalea sp. TBR-22]
MADDWRRCLLTTPSDIRQLLHGVSRVAVLGARPASYAHKAAYYVPEALQDMGLTIVPVVVHDHVEPRILGEPVYRRLVDVPGQLDLVDVFRRPEDLPGHVDDILARAPRAVWFQSGIRNDAVAETLARAGIQVVQDRCLMIDYRNHGRR